MADTGDRRAGELLAATERVERLADVVDGDEVVVGADLLNLSERLEQRRVVPEPYVFESRVITRDVVGRQPGVAGDGACFDSVERERPARRGDVVLDERRLAHLLVRRDREPLHHAAVALAADRDERVEGDGRRDRPVPASERMQHREGGPDDAGNDLNKRGRHATVDIGVAGAVNQPGGLHEIFRSLQPCAPRHQQQEHGDQQREMTSSSRRHRHASWES